MKKKIAASQTTNEASPNSSNWLCAYVASEKNWPSLLLQLKEFLADHTESWADLKDSLEPLKKSGPNLETGIPALPYRSHELYIGARQIVQVLLVEENISNYYLQEATRKTFSPLYSKKWLKNAQIDLTHVSAEQQTNLVDYLCCLETLSTWKAEVFGLKAQKKKNSTKTSDDKKHLRFEQINFVSSLNKTQIEEIAIKAHALSKATNLVRGLADLPGNVLTPAHYLQKALKLAKELKVQSHFYNQKELQKMQAGAFLAVAQAAQDRQFGILHLSYKPSSAKKSKSKKESAPAICLVGKGLCFDTGGYNIKTGNYMYTMHRDMTGSAVALALFQMLVEEKVSFEVHAYLALAENLISPTAFRPNDVVVASNGVSIEVVDTDAEGRMVLADTLALASKQNPKMMLDFATLTGTCVRAIGTKRSGVFTNQSKYQQLAYDCGEQSGERVWAFPVGEDYWEGLKSEIADIRQLSSTSNTDHIYAATFLSRFVTPNIPWFHVDLSSETQTGGLGLVESETTGFGVRFARELIRKFCS